MEIKKIFEDDKRVIKAVWLHGKFFYTVTYILDKEGYVEKMVRVFSDGTVYEHSKQEV